MPVRILGKPWGPAVRLSPSWGTTKWVRVILLFLNRTAPEGGPMQTQQHLSPAEQGACSTALHSYNCRSAYLAPVSSLVNGVGARPQGDLCQGKCQMPPFESQLGDEQPRDEQLGFEALV
jgi:hypothetical protein